MKNKYLYLLFFAFIGALSFNMTANDNELGDLLSKNSDSTSQVASKERPKELTCNNCHGFMSTLRKFSFYLLEAGIMYSVMYGYDYWRHGIITSQESKDLWHEALIYTIIFELALKDQVSSCLLNATRESPSIKSLPREAQ